MTAVDPLVALLVAARKAAGLKQATLARAMNCGQQNVAVLETGRTDTRLSTLRRWAGALGLQPALVPLAYETAPVDACTAAGNGATEGGVTFPPDVPASSPTPTDVGEGRGPGEQITRDW